MKAYRLTAAGLMRALSGGRIRQEIDESVQRHADRVAAAIAEAGAIASVERRGPADYVVRARAGDLFARAFGSRERPPEATVSAAVRRAGGGA